jgi:hypothetical protein
MAEYGTVKYGAAKYGAYGTSGADTLLWAIEIDWDGNGLFSGYNEAQHCTAFSSQRGRNFFVRQDGKGFEHYRTGNAYLTLVNRDGRFDPFNASSPLYPDVEPGKYIKIWVRDGATGNNYDVIAGRVESIEPFRKNDIEYVRISLTDGWRWLLDHNASIALQTDTRTDTAIGLILDAVDWPTIWGRALGQGDDIIPYWWEDQRSAATAINDLVDSENGRFYPAADGTATFEGRNQTNTSVVTITQDEMGREISVLQPWEVVRNVVEVVAHPRISQDGAEIWRLQDTTRVGAGESLALFADFVYENRKVAGTNLVTPVDTTDYTMNAAADGSGADLTANFTVAITSTFSQTAKLTITNTGGSDGYITLLRLRGDAIDNPDNVILKTDGSNGAQPRIFTLDSKHQQDVNQAVSYSQYLEDYLSNVRRFPAIRLENRVAEQFTPDLTDRVTLTAATISLNDDYRVGMIEHNWLSENGQAVETRMRFEPFIGVGALWDVAEWDVGEWVY